MMVRVGLKKAVQVPALVKFALRLSRPLAGLCILTAVALAFWSGEQLQAAQAQESESTLAISATPAVSQQSVPTSSLFPSDGQYLFGEVSQRDQIGHGYMILENNGDEVFGALYYPHSSFDCFYGTVQEAELAMTIINSYTQETYPYSIALVSDSAVASTLPDGLEPMTLSGFHAIDDITENDLRMLDVCRSAVTTEI